MSEILDASDFYRESHAKMYRAALALWSKGEPVDAITLVNELDERAELDAAGGQARVAELAALVPAASNVEHYARIVKEMSTLRGLIRAGQEIVRLGQEREGEVSDLVDRAEQIVFELGPAACDERLLAHRGAPEGELRAHHAPVRGGRRDHRRACGLP